MENNEVKIIFKLSTMNEALDFLTEIELSTGIESVSDQCELIREMIRNGERRKVFGDKDSDQV